LLWRADAHRRDHRTGLPTASSAISAHQDRHLMSVHHPPRHLSAAPPSCWSVAGQGLAHPAFARTWSPAISDRAAPYCPFPWCIQDPFTSLLRSRSLQNRPVPPRPKTINPHSARGALPSFSLAGSSPGGFRTPGPLRAAIVVMDRYPIPFTRAVIGHVHSITSSARATPLAAEEMPRDYQFSAHTASVCCVAMSDGRCGSLSQFGPNCDTSLGVLLSAN
jgi:hypothetical protein